MASLTITEAELLEALAVSTSAPDNALTAEELAIKGKCSPGKVRNVLRALSLEGRLVVHRVRRSRVDGVACTVPAYTVKAKATKK